MMEKLSLIVFVMVAVGTALLWLVAGSGRLRLGRRLVDRPEKAVPTLYSHALIWRELVNRIGKVLPEAPKDLPRLKRRLICAGYRHPSAARYFRSIRAVSTVVTGIVVFFVASQFAPTLDNLLLAAGAGCLLGYIA